MTTGQVKMPPKTMAGFEHSRNGRVICRSVDITFPELPPLPIAPASLDINCIKKYKKKLDDWLAEYKRDLDYYELICLYHEARMNYVYKHIDDDIPEKYRTGEDVPDTIMGLLKEITKLKIKK